MGHPSRSMEDRGAEDELNCGGLAQEVSEGKNISMWPKDQSYDILTINMAALGVCPKSLLKSLN